MNRIKILKFTFILLLLSLVLQGCVEEKISDVDTYKNSDHLKVSFTNHAIAQQSVTISTFRIIAFNSAGSVEINKTMADLGASGSNFELNLRPGVYTLFAIGNEKSDMSSGLSNAKSISDVDDIRINMIENHDSTTLPLAYKNVIYVRPKSEGSKIGQISINNMDWMDNMTILTDRLASKLEFLVRRERNYVGTDEVIIKSITINQIPKYSHITPKTYGGEYYSMVNDINKKIDTAYIDNLTLLLNRIYPEHMPSAADNDTFAEMEMEINGKIEKALIKIGAMERNKIYRYEILVKRRSIEIANVVVKPWTDENIDTNIEGIAINLSRVEVPYSYPNSSIIYFTTKNITKTNLTLNPFLYSEKNEQIGELNTVFTTNFNYSYDANTGIGSGYITIQGKAPYMSKYIHINAAGITKRIYIGGLEFAGSNIYWDDVANQLKFDDTPSKGQTAPHQDYQGLYFKWGSIYGIGGIDMRSPELIFNPSNLTYASYLDIPYARVPNNPSPDENIDNLVALSKATGYNQGTGDICRFMTARGWTPNGTKWKIPTLAEISLLTLTTDFTPVGDFNAINILPNKFGQNKMPSGTMLGNIFWPTSGVRAANTGILTSEIGYYGFYQSSTADQHNISIFNNIKISRVEPQKSICHRDVYITVRCVKDYSSDPIVPVYALTYDLTSSTSTTPLKIQYSDKGGSTTLSNTVHTSTDGRVQNGWLINGKEYKMGENVDNIQSDLVAHPLWLGHNINGTIWASTNLKASKEFAPNPEFMAQNNYFAWNNLTPGSVVYPSYDPNRDPCPDGWRVPKSIELDELLKSGHFAGIRENGTRGFWFGIDRQPNENEFREYMFIPLSGYKDDFNISFTGERFLLNSIDMKTASQVDAIMGTWSTKQVGRYYYPAKKTASPIRCVKK